MQSKLIAAVGAALVIGGAVALYLAYEGASPAFAATSWAAIIIGAMAMMMAASRGLSGFLAPQKAAESAYGQDELRLLVQTMAVMAAADGKIAGQEIEAIIQVHERMLGLAISADEVSAILSGIGPGFDIAGELERQRNRLSPQFRALLVKCAWLIMMSDFVEHRRETETIHAIGRALGFEESDIDDMVAAASA
ncbi:MAG: TerB family tellurite resistance protein [Nitratireductor sp.]|nr:TerB family tellurite resistance protein [Nitratireductor sp.]MCB1457525.1 TerB family tellurite resistance protein [Nitratireductor sp.]MCB1460062.1 TerB family tellurite resistance protein [Nitratireductor sp.]